MMLIQSHTGFRSDLYVFKCVRTPRGREFLKVSALFPLTTFNPVCFQQRSWLDRIKSFDFNHIPALAPMFAHRSFVFNDIPGSFGPCFENALSF